MPTSSTCCCRPWSTGRSAGGTWTRSSRSPSRRCALPRGGGLVAGLCPRCRRSVPEALTASERPWDGKGPLRSLIAASMGLFPAARQTRLASDRLNMRPAVAQRCDQPFHLRLSPVPRSWRDDTLALDRAQGRPVGSEDAVVRIFLPLLQGQPAGGRLRRPPSAGSEPPEFTQSAVQKPQSGLCEHFPPQTSNTYCPFRTNGAGYPSQGSARQRCTRKGGISSKTAPPEGPEDRRRDADANIIFQVGPHQVLIGTAPDLCSVLV
jgi:hypothetical protein